MYRIKIERYSDIYDVTITRTGSTIYHDRLLARSRKEALARVFSIADCLQVKRPALVML